MKRLWRAFAGLFRSRPMSADEVLAHQKAEDDRARAKDAWLADEARQSRQSTTIGG